MELRGGRGAGEKRREEKKEAKTRLRGSWLVDVPPRLELASCAETPVECLISTGSWG
jgi:hypothetical protein